jgi:succinate dehydrogenase / fumarate reductase, iron-sulfur subunit
METTLRILRYNPETDEKPAWKEYAVEVEPTDRLLDALHQVKWYQDGTLAFRRSCAHGVCGSDAMTINNVNGLACKVLMRDLGARVKIEPLRGFRVIKDLVVDMEPFMEKYRSIKPYFINYDPPPPVERFQSQEARERYDDTTRCILCAACTSACPSFWGNPEFVGPAAIVQAHRFIFDDRDQGANERLEILNDRDGVWRCRTIFNCTGACPRDIQITQAIGEVKKLLLFNRMV